MFLLCYTVKQYILLTILFFLFGRNVSGNYLDGTVRRSEQTGIEKLTFSKSIAQLDSELLSIYLILFCVNLVVYCFLEGFTVTTIVQDRKALK